ncbi:conjugal transfer protein TraF [Thaumasiovibrio sp. DFM-14]|uniref:conjugal transfer protein TraF n=1 Tax=Thaumasiovibrio sp. DFM-14 TaxID=3384792 RepID=UPI00399FB500
MLNKNKLQLALSVVGLSVISTQAVADARGFAMGGVGVATSNYLAAPMYNPALAANYDRERDNFGMLLPTFSAGVHDGDDLYNKLDAFADLTDELEFGDANSATAAEWKKALLDLDGGKGVVDAELGLVIAIPNRFASISFFTKAEVAMIVTPDVDKRDQDLVNNDGTINSCDDGKSLEECMQSSAQGLGAVIGEVGLTIAGSKLLQLGDKDYPVSFGLSPKAQHLMAINYTTKASDFDDDEFGDDYTEKTVFNADFGMTIQPNARTTVGFVAKNLLKQELETNNSSGTDVMLVEPQYAVGVGYNYGWVTLAADVDLNERQYFRDLDYATQFASIGAEINAWRWAQVRVGYKHSMTDHSEDVVSAGLGLTPFGRFGMDLSAQYGDDSRYGVAAQFIFTF